MNMRNIGLAMLVCVACQKEAAELPTSRGTGADPGGALSSVAPGHTVLPGCQPGNLSGYSVMSWDTTYMVGQAPLIYAAHGDTARVLALYECSTPTATRIFADVEYTWTRPGTVFYWVNSGSAQGLSEVNAVLINDDERDVTNYAPHSTPERRVKRGVRLNFGPWNGFEYGRTYTIRVDGLSFTFDLVH